MDSLDAIRSGDRRALAKAITLVESRREDHQQRAQQLLEQLLPDSGNSVRIGITGTPGVGKSTFIEAFGMYLLSLGKRVAVLAVDPSSPIAGGSILGDKTRMETLAREEHAFIRPSPSEGTLGGVAHKTRETLLLCEAAAYDVILVETVGVGQSEYEVASMVDFFLVLMLPNAGDELQGIKKGIMELADALLVNKADGESVNLARQTQTHYQSALHLLSSSSFWSPKVLNCSALENRGIDSVWEMIHDYCEIAVANGYWKNRRAEQNRQWLKRLLHDMLERRMDQSVDIKQVRPELERQVTEGEITPLSAASKLIDLL
ncbi:MAG: methylmalonyl Co-A mutase-associated GTPase MeaB [Pseudomonadota bacterium]